MQKSSKTLVLLSVASLLLSGCAALQQDQQGSEQRQEQSQRGAIDTICVVRHQNPQLSSDRLVQAIEAGLKQRGVKTRVVNHDQVPSECRLCLFYGVTAENNVAKSFDFQAVIDGKALQRGSGPGAGRRQHQARDDCLVRGQLFAKPCQCRQAERSPAGDCSLANAG